MYYFTKGRKRPKGALLRYILNLIPVIGISRLRYSIAIPMHAHYVDPQTPGQWNKLPGVSSLFIHKNSQRLAWRPTEDGRYELALYRYIDGVRTIEGIGTFEYGYMYHFPIDCYPNKKVWWKAFAYHGGKLAPFHDYSLIADVIYESPT